MEVNNKLLQEYWIVINFQPIIWLEQTKNIKHAYLGGGLELVPPEL